MFSTGGFRSENFVLNVGYDGAACFSSDSTGDQPASIELIGGSFTTAISRTIWNRTGAATFDRMTR